MPNGWGGEMLMVNPRQRLLLRLHSWVFVVLIWVIVALIAWMGQRHSWEWDMTSAGRFTLSPASQTLLRQMPGTVQIRSFTRLQQQVGLRERITQLVARYQRHKPDIELQFIDPDQEPERVREYGISLDGELAIHYQGRQQQLQTIGEQALTYALERLLRGGERQLRFLSGHGERSPEGDTNHGLSEWARQLSRKGFVIEPLNLQQQLLIPTSTAALIIASPQVALLAQEQQLINDYVLHGGNLLWLRDPDDALRLERMAEILGLQLLPGTVVDTAGEQLGIDHPGVVVSSDYPPHAITRGLDILTLYPLAQGIDAVGEGWQALPLVKTLERSWTEREPLRGEIHFNPEREQQGPLYLAWALSRPRSAAIGGQSSTSMGGEQRVVVVGDGDFLSNAYLGNGANQQLGDRIINWLSGDDGLIAIPTRTAIDQQLQMSQTHLMGISFGFLLLLPILLAGVGARIWQLRRRR